MFTASTQSTQGNAVVDQSPTQIDVTLNIATHIYVAWIIGDLEMVQMFKKYAINEKYVSIATSVLIDALEASLFGLWSGLSTNTVGDTATVLSDAEIVEAIEKLDTLNYDVMNKAAFFFHPLTQTKQGDVKSFLIDLNAEMPTRANVVSIYYDAERLNKKTLETVMR